MLLLFYRIQIVHVNQVLMIMSVVNWSVWPHRYNVTS